MSNILGSITEKELLSKTTLSQTTLRIYLGRAEFSHIEKGSLGKGKFVYLGVTNEDIKRLKELKNRRRGILYC